jgi:hypothetical protein
MLAMAVTLGLVRWRTLVWRGCENIEQILSFANCKKMLWQMRYDFGRFYWYSGRGPVAMRTDLEREQQTKWM